MDRRKFCYALVASYLSIGSCSARGQGFPTGEGIHDLVERANSEDDEGIVASGALSAEGCMLSAGIGSNPFDGVLGSSGNVGVDRLFQREGEFLLRSFPVIPYGYFLRDDNAPNAFASSKSINRNGPHGTILFGIRLLTEEFERDGGAGFAIPGIFAHEFAHIFQFSSGFQAPTPIMELHADFLAGWYLARRSQIPGIWTDVRPALQSFFEKGDYAFNDPSHHGTPNQRLAAVQAGLVSRTSRADEAFALGLRYLGQ
ncbi:MAG: hypothetical protein NXH95_17390 [Pseudomonadaceae bacterium]|nr:hypothetical protein [Pseudomonadaceae bacterium]